MSDVAERAARLSGRHIGFTGTQAQREAGVSYAAQPTRVTYRATADGHDTRITVEWRTREAALRHVVELRELPNVSEVVVEFQGEACDG